MGPFDSDESRATKTQWLGPWRCCGCCLRVAYIIIMFLPRPRLLRPQWHRPCAGGCHPFSFARMRDDIVSNNKQQQRSNLPNLNILPTSFKSLLHIFPTSKPYLLLVSIFGQSSKISFETLPTLKTVPTSCKPLLQICPTSKSCLRPFNLS